ncbi:MAG: hypothetical protein JWR05_3503 [Mucilaginibacter sp.]|nr:hypothetical protein [Mucilaginibacter sp.]
MSDLKAFIENKIKTAQQEIKKIDIEIQAKAASLFAKKAPFEKEAALYKKLLREYEETDKPTKGVKSK